MTSPRSDTPWLAPETPEIVWFGGPDALEFLNALISQELGDMTPGESRRSFLLVPQGKLHFLLWALREEERIGLVTDPGRGDELAAALDRYRIGVEVDIAPQTGKVWVVVGEWDGFDVSWPGIERHLVIGERPDLVEGSADEYESLRVNAGVPKWGVDVDEATIPHESGLVASSVDFDKGCFLGQELVARIESRGANTPRHLRLLAASGDITAGDVVSFGGEEVGVVTSAADSVGLAMLRRKVAVGDTVEVGGSTADVAELPLKSQG
ncbi:MAG: YgfZ/GcvT domain-containing protein [Acidimicrobiia bacterium]